MNLSVQHQLVLFWTCLFYSSLLCPRTYLVSPQEPMLSPDISVLQQSMFPPDVSVFTVQCLCFPWTYLFTAICAHPGVVCFVLPLNAPVLQQSVLPLDLFVYQQLVLSLDESVQHRLLLLLDVSLVHCTAVWSVLGLFCSTAASAAPEYTSICSIAVFVHVDVCSTVICSFI